ncbi:MAG TPA: carotenoid biosynthesis protein [Thermomicrobiales bacterium]|nr:carotenoid biosynthesis protein [Thermomicrobiales bacterium]
MNHRVTGRSWIPRVLIIAHLVALVFGLVGLLIMLPHPDLWSSDPHAVRVFDFSMRYAGSTHILFGAAAMFTYGLVALGWRKTVIFAACAYSISICAELIGTGTGWPFGNYSYTDFLGYKVLGRVPFTIPMSWFYMGFASYLLGTVLAARRGVKRQTLWSLALGVWLLTAWDLVLDPAMAHPSLRVQFWVWHESGPYFGMPIRNLVGWSLTGLLFMVASRWLWRSQADGRTLPATIPLIVYTANLGFAMVLSAGVGLWVPILLSALLGLVPAVIAANRRLPAHRWTLAWAKDG